MHGKWLGVRIPSHETCTSCIDIACFHRFTCDRIDRYEMRAKNEFERGESNEGGLIDDEQVANRVSGNDLYLWNCCSYIVKH